MSGGSDGENPGQARQGDGAPDGKHKKVGRGAAGQVPGWGPPPHRHQATGKGKRVSGAAVKATGSDATSAVEKQGTTSPRVHQNGHAAVWGAQGVHALKRGMAQTETGSLEAPGKLNSLQLQRHLQLMTAPPTLVQSGRLSIATEPTPLHRDDALRSMSTQEQQAFAAYLQGEVPISDPPQFLKATIPREARLQVLAFHKSNLEGVLIAKVPTGVHMGKRSSYKGVVIQLLNSNAQGAERSPALDAFARAIKRMDYDSSTRLITATLDTRQHALAWDRSTFKLQNGKVTFMADLMGASTQPMDVYTATKLERLYKLRIKCSSLISALDIAALMEKTFAAPVLTLNRGTSEVLDKFDQQHWAVTLQSERCPPLLQDVNHLGSEKGEIFIHRADVHTRPPCFSCFGNSHVAADCKTPDVAKMIAKHHRDVELLPASVKKFDMEQVKSHGVTKIFADLLALAEPKVLPAADQQSALTSSVTAPT